MGGDIILDHVIFTLVIDYLVLISMISIIAKNKIMDFNKRAGFIASFILILTVSTIELVSLLIDEYLVDYRYINLVFINSYLILSPLVAILYAGAVSGFSNKSFWYILGFYAVYFIFIIVAIPLKLIFYIEDNDYIGASCYPVFIVVYAIFCLYLICICFIRLKKFQSANWFGLIVLAIAYLGGSIVQLYNTKIHTAWSSLTLILVVYYAYYNALCRQFDEMTEMYSHQAYLGRCERIRAGETLIIMDCDNFKLLNDTYGHQEGDKALIEVSTIIREIFKGAGICYRIGGDEFAVIVYKDKDVSDLILRLKESLEIRRRDYNHLPTISIGYMIYDGKMSISDFKSLTDKEMYTNKHNK